MLFCPNAPFPNDIALLRGPYLSSLSWHLTASDAGSGLVRQGPVFELYVAQNNTYL
jgi:hypothetical protein